MLPGPSLLDALARSEVAFALSLRGELCALCGVVPLVLPASSARTGPVGMVWALSGTAVERHRRAYARASRYVLSLFAARYEWLVALVDARYTRALRWAAWLGFTLGSPVPYGPHAAPFRPVTYGMHGMHGMHGRS